MSEEEIIEQFKNLINNPMYDYIVLKDEDGFTMWNKLFERDIRII